MGRGMVDLVGTCPLDFWEEWIAEGDPAGAPWSGEEWGWYTHHRDAQLIKPGDRFYVVAHGRVRGYAPVTRLVSNEGGGFVICREGGAVAVTIADRVPGFRGLMVRWWDYAAELPFPNWQTEGVLSASERAQIAREEKQRREHALRGDDLFGGDKLDG